jgi:hypothetical protein
MDGGGSWAAGAGPRNDMKTTLSLLAYGAGVLVGTARLVVFGR